jgi:hypothetical protein
VVFVVVVVATLAVVAFVSSIVDVEVDVVVPEIN